MNGTAIGVAIGGTKVQEVQSAIELAEELMAKSPAVLRGTKQAVKMVRSMDFGQSYDYLAAKYNEIKALDKQDSYKSGLDQFLDQKSYKPTFEPFKLKNEDAE